MRILLHTGKGGAGKTTVAAATALRCAALGYRTLLASVDATGSLGDVLDVAVGPEPVAVTTGLSAQLVDAGYEAASRWGALDTWIQDALSRHVGVPSFGTPAALPGLADVGGLVALLTGIESGPFDVVVVDAMPAALLVRVLTALDELAPLAERLPDTDGLAARLARPLARRLLDLPAPDEAAIAAARDLLVSLGRARALLSGHELTSFRLVVSPDRLALAESRRARIALSLYGYAIDAVIHNRAQAGAAAAPGRPARPIDADLAGLPILTVPRWEDAPIGVGPLAVLGGEIYDGRDPTAHMTPNRPSELLRDGHGFVLSIPLAGARPEDLAVTRAGDRLTIGAGVVRRTIVLPSAIAGLECSGARFDGTTLRLPFHPPARDAPT